MERSLLVCIVSLYLSFGCWKLAHCSLDTGLRKNWNFPRSTFKVELCLSCVESGPKTQNAR